MRPLLVIAVGLPTLLSALGCVAFTDPVGPIALDYQIDRVLVPAIRLDPPTPIQGLPVSVEALVLAPGSIETVNLDVCGLDTQRVAQLWDTSCFDNEELIEQLATELPATWQVPMQGSACEADTGMTDTGLTVYECAARVPLRVTATSQGEIGMGALLVDLLREPPETPPSRLAQAPRTLETEGIAARGEELALIYRVDWDGDLDFRWYVDAGVLHHTGRTATTWLQGDRHTTRNRLEIPTGFVGELRVVVVATAVGDRDPSSGNVAWDVLTLEVQ